MTNPDILKSAEEIADYIDESVKNIPVLVKEKGLPAAKFNNRWKALKRSVDAWLKMVYPSA